MRLFIGLTPSEPLRDRLRSSLEPLASTNPDLRWVPPEVLHVTLVFLGEVDDGRVPAIRDAMSWVAARHCAFELRIRSSGTFGSPASPRVLWLGVSGELEALGQLQGDQEDALEPLGFAPQRERYTPHLTVARSRRERGAQLMKPLAEAMRDFESEPWRVEEVTLFVSRAGKYEPLVQAPLSYGAKVAT